MKTSSTCSPTTTNRRKSKRPRVIDQKLNIGPNGTISSETPRASLVTPLHKLGNDAWKSLCKKRAFTPYRDNHDNECYRIGTLALTDPDKQHGVTHFVTMEGLGAAISQYSDLDEFIKGVHYDTGRLVSGLLPDEWQEWPDGSIRMRSDSNIANVTKFSNFECIGEMILEGKTDSLKAIANRIHAAAVLASTEAFGGGAVATAPEGFGSPALSRGRIKTEEDNEAAAAAAVTPGVSPQAANATVKLEGEDDDAFAARLEGNRDAISEHADGGTPATTTIAADELAAMRAKLGALEAQVKDLKNKTASSS